jgi:hypothetical protein
METTSAPPEAAPARRRVPVRTRLDFWYDGLLLVAYTLVYSLGFTGLAVHEWLGLGIGLAILYQLGISVRPGPFWTNVHDTTSKLTLILVPVHVAMRWRWIVSVGRRLLSRPGRGRPRSSR